MIKLLLAWVDHMDGVFNGEHKKYRKWSRTEWWLALPHLEMGDAKKTNGKHTN